MHNLDAFLKFVEDDISTDNESVASIPAPAATKAKRGKAKVVAKVEEEVQEASSSSKSAGSSSGSGSSKKEGALNGGVNFVLNDIDNAHSLVSIW